MKNIILNIAIIVSAIILGTFLGIIAHDYQNIKTNDKKIDYVKVPIAKVELNSLTNITEENIEYKNIPLSLISNDVITHINDILGKKVKENFKIPPGSFFFKEKITEDNIIENYINPLPERMYLYPLKNTNNLNYQEKEYLSINLSGAVNGVFLESIHINMVNQNYIYVELLPEMIAELMTIEKLENINISLTKTTFSKISNRGAYYADEYLKAYIDSKKMNFN